MTEIEIVFTAIDRDVDSEDVTGLTAAAYVRLRAALRNAGFAHDGSNFTVSRRINLDAKQVAAEALTNRRAVLAKIDADERFKRFDCEICGRTIDKPTVRHGFEGHVPVRPTT